MPSADEMRRAIDARLAPDGYFADVVVFDADRIGRGPEIASDDFPGDGVRWIRRQEGVDQVIVNRDPNLRAEKSWTSELTAERARGDDVLRAVGRDAAAGGEVKDPHTMTAAELEAFWTWVPTKAEVRDAWSYRDLADEEWDCALAFVGRDPAPSSSSCTRFMSLP